jgi:hypothetical protein
VRIRPTTSNIFPKSLAFHLSSLTTSTSMRVGDRGVGSQRCSTTVSRYGTGGMEASSWVMVGPEVRRVSLGENA